MTDPAGLPPANVTGNMTGAGGQANMTGNMTGGQGTPSANHPTSP
jgi:hypothetical protein